MTEAKKAKTPSKPKTSKTPTDALEKRIAARKAGAEAKPVIVTTVTTEPKQEELPFVPTVPVAAAPAPAKPEKVKRTPKPKAEKPAQALDLSALVEKISAKATAAAEKKHSAEIKKLEKAHSLALKGLRMVHQGFVRKSQNDTKDAIKAAAAVEGKKAYDQGFKEGTKSAHRSITAALKVK